MDNYKTIMGNKPLEEVFVPKPNIEKINGNDKTNKKSIEKINKNKNKNKDMNIPIHKILDLPNNIDKFEQNLIKKTEEKIKKNKELKIKKNEELVNEELKIKKKKESKKMNKNLEQKKLNNNLDENGIINTNTDANTINKMKQSRNYLNNDFDEDEVRQPIPQKTDCLIGNVIDINNENEFEMFKNQILMDNSLDSTMKQIIIDSRSDFIKRQKQKIEENTQKILKINLIVPLQIKLKDVGFNKISTKNKEKILLLIDKWVDDKINLISLDSESLYQLYELVDQIGLEKKIKTEKIKNIFAPTNPDEFIELIEMMEIIKNQSIQEENKRIQKELELKKIQEENEIKQKELELLKIQEINTRNEQVKLLLFNLNKISGYDCEIKNLKNNLELPVNKYCNLETDQILMDENVYTNTIKFIKSIRMGLQDKETLLKKCKYL